MCQQLMILPICKIAPAEAPAGLSEIVMAGYRKRDSPTNEAVKNFVRDSQYLNLSPFTLHTAKCSDIKQNVLISNSVAFFIFISADSCTRNIYFKNVSQDFWILTK